jgi:dTDP-4-amino-4,6-dideoxygalactose transaminase
MMHPSEQQLAVLFQRESAVLTGRASSGLCALLDVLDRRGSTVLLPANTCFIVLWAVIASGYRAALVDIDLATGGIDPAVLGHWDGVDVSVIITHHFGGIPSDIDALMRWARQHDVFVIEDAAIAFGGQLNNQPLGGIGDAAVVSFGTDKILDLRHGGAVLIDDAGIARQVRVLVDDYANFSRLMERLEREWDDIYWGLHRHESTPRRLEGLYPGLFETYRQVLKIRPDDRLNTLLSEGLAQLPQNLAARRKRERMLMDMLPTDALVIPANVYGNPLWKFSFLVHHDLREDVLAALWEMNVIHTTCWYPSLMPMARELQPDVRQFPTPNADLWGASIINLPMDDKMTPLLAQRANVAIRSALGLN